MNKHVSHTALLQLPHGGTCRVDGADLDDCLRGIDEVRKQYLGAKVVEGPHPVGTRRGDHSDPDDEEVSEAEAREIREYLRSVRDEQAAMIRDLRAHKHHIATHRHQSFTEMADELREMATQLKHWHISNLSARRPQVHKSLAACTDIPVSPLTPAESAKFYDFLYGAPAIRARRTA